MRSLVLLIISLLIKSLTINQLVYFRASYQSYLSAEWYAVFYHHIQSRHRMGVEFFSVWSFKSGEWSCGDVEQWSQFKDLKIQYSDIKHLKTKKVKRVMLLMVLAALLLTHGVRSRDSSGGTCYHNGRARWHLRLVTILTAVTRWLMLMV